MASPVLSNRALNRATLARQLLLQRSRMPVLHAVEHLVGLQAQEPLNPYTGLWSRLERFGPESLATLLEQRKVVRIPLMRSTIHLVSAQDCLILRPLMQPVLDAEMRRHAEFAPHLRDLDLEPILELARSLLAEQPRTGRELQAELAVAFPGENARALAYACRNYLPLVQVPPRGIWGRTAQVTSTTVAAWLGRPLAANPSLDEIVLRYLGAFGPATVADCAAWSRLTGIREVVERLRPRLQTFRNEAGRELFDLPDAPRPGPETQAPARFLPLYDNLLLSHADRSRFYVDRERFSAATGAIHGSVLSDGLVYGVWRIERDRDRATLEVECVNGLTKRAAAAVEAEARRYLRFLGEEGDVEVLEA